MTGVESEVRELKFVLAFSLMGVILALFLIFDPDHVSPMATALCVAIAPLGMMGLGVLSLVEQLLEGDETLATDGGERQ